MRAVVFQYRKTTISEFIRQETYADQGIFREAALMDAYSRPANCHSTDMKLSRESHQFV